jgi:hypothetical protein
MAASAAGLPLAARASAATRDLAQRAYVWGYPSVDLYAILRGQALERASPEFKAPLNAIGHARSVASPRDRVVIAPNVDTPYSHAWMDLRAEPVVLTVPAFEGDPQREMDGATRGTRQLNCREAQWPSPSCVRDGCCSRWAAPRRWPRSRARRRSGRP